MSSLSSGSDSDIQPHNDDDVAGSSFSKLKVGISLLISFHLCAVGLPPLAFQTAGESGPSPLIGILIRPFEGYSQFTHMNRGYAFFAPNPPVANYLIQAAQVGPDGEIIETIYPDRERQWPRLLYHRHFMLTEFLNRVYIPPGPPNELYESEPEAAADWKRRRALYEYVRQSMVDHLQSKNEGREVAIRRIEHFVPDLLSFQDQPIALTDERLYQVLLDQPLFSDPMAPNPAAEEIPIPGTNSDATIEPLPSSKAGQPADSSGQNESDATNDAPGADTDSFGKEDRNVDSSMGERSVREDSDALRSEQTETMPTQSTEAGSGP